MIPYHQLVGDADAPHLGFVLHGVMGAGHNFRSFVKRLAEARPEYRFALIDLRYHGGSLGAPPPHTLEACADDLFELSEHLGQSPRAVIGHSLGGKVGLVFGRRFFDEVPGHHRPSALGCSTFAQVWALDSDPGAQQPNHSHQVLRVLRALSSHPGPFRTRGDAILAITSEQLSSGLAQWLATSLERRRTAAGEEFTWKLDLTEIAELLDDYFRVDLWPFLERIARLRPSSPLFELLVAENSDRWSGSMKERADSLPAGGGLRVHSLPDSGHWVHVDNPTGLLRILTEHLV